VDALVGQPDKPINSMAIPADGGSHDEENEYPVGIGSRPVKVTKPVVPNCFGTAPALEVVVIVPAFVVDDVAATVTLPTFGVLLNVPNAITFVGHTLSMPA
jgi:hypothetical protein